MPDTPIQKHRPKLIDAAKLTDKERAERATTARAAEVAARNLVLSEAPIFMLRLMAQDRREQLLILFDEAQFGRVDLYANSCAILETAKSLAKIEKEIHRRKVYRLA